MKIISLAVLIQAVVLRKIQCHEILQKLGGMPPAFVVTVVNLKSAVEEIRNIILSHFFQYFHGWCVVPKHNRQEN
jgi:acid phosphatase family membrane protein YuiD